ncbi:hypothetical protein D3C81_1596890 [compost metagenome]
MDDPLLHPGGVIGMDARLGDVLREVAKILIRRIGERAGESLVCRQRVVFHVPDKRAEQGPGIQRQTHPLVVGAVSTFGFLPPAFGVHELGGFHHHRHHSGRLAVIIGHRAVIQVHPDVFGDAIAQQHQLFIAKRQGAAGQAGIDHMPVEIGDFRPAQLHRRTE